MTSGYARSLAAATSASRLLNEAGVDQTRQVDVFGLVESLGLWLAFFPLDGLLGVYLPEGTGGILVTTERSTPIQRYTAAHELGHWRLDDGNDAALDTESDVLGRTDGERETLAQVFAGALLMPPPLVHTILSRRKSASLGPLDVYTVAREAGVSYEAAARQLYHLDRLTYGELREMLKVQPLKVKQLIGAGRRPVVGVADVWPVDMAWHGQQLKVQTDDEIIVSLPEDRSTGYRWSIPGPDPRPRNTEAPPHFTGNHPFGSDETPLAESRLVARRKPPSHAVDRERRVVPTAKPKPVPIAGGRAAVVGDVYIADGTSSAMTGATIRSRRLARLGLSEAREAIQHVRDEKVVVGSVGRRVLGVRVTEPGTTLLRFVLQNAYSDADPVDEYRITAAVEERRKAFPINQIRDDDDDWAEAVLERRRSAASTSVDDLR